MTKEQIEQKADMYIKDFHGTELSKIDLVLFAEQLVSEATKELKEHHKNVCEELTNTHRNLGNENKELREQKEELENKLGNIRYYLDNEIPHEFINEATNIIYKMV